MSDKVQILDLKDTLDDLTEKINNFLAPYTTEPAFWVILAIIIFLIGCWAIRYFGRK